MATLSPRTRKRAKTDAEAIRRCIETAAGAFGGRRWRGAATRCRNDLVRLGGDEALAEQCAQAAVSVAHAIRLAEDRVRRSMRLLAISRGIPVHLYAHTEEG